MQVFSSLIIIFLILVIIAAAIGLGYFWYKSRRYTREKFAFAALAAITSILMIAAISIFIGAAPWQIMFTFAAQLLDFEYTPKQTTTLEYGFFILLFGIFIYFLKHIYDNWSGATSIKQHKRAQRQEPSSIIIDGYDELIRIVKRLPAPEIYNPDDSNGIGSILKGSEDTLVWHQQVIELIMLKSKSYFFDKDEGWHDQQRCWVGRQKKTGDMVVVGCWIEPPSETQLKTLVNYARNQAKKNNQLDNELEIKVAIKSETNLIDTKTIDGIEVKFEYESQLLNNLVDFTDYINDIKDKVNNQDLPESNLTINDIYVPSGFTLEEDSNKYENIEDYLQEWLLDSSKRQIALLGEYGQGKSTASLLFTYHLLTHDQATRIPILIELRGKSPRNMTIKEILAAWAEPYDISPRALMKLLIAGRFVLILEGFDEMDLTGDAEIRLNHFKTLWQFCYPKSKIIITGRPNFFLDDKEMKAGLGIHEPTWERPYCQALHLLPFSIEKIEQSLRAVDKQTRQEIVELYKQDKKFKEIVSRPSLLNIVSILWKTEQLSQYKGKINSALVMQLFIKHSLARQTAKVQDHRNFMILNSSEREYFMLGIAAYMAVNDLPNQITKQQLDEAVRLLLKVIPDSASTVDSMSGESSKPLHKRLSEDEEKAIESVKTDVRSCGLLVSDLSKSDAFKFAHKSFMEYLFAKLVYNKLTKDDLSEEELEITMSIWKKLEANISSILEYPESVSFMAELLYYSKLSKDTNSNFIKEIFHLIVLPKQSSIYYILQYYYNIVILFRLEDNIHKRLIQLVIAVVILLYFISNVFFLKINDSLLAKLLIYVPISSLLFAYSIDYAVNKYNFRLLYQCCKVLNIDREEIAKVIGKWIMPILENLEKDYK